MNGLPTAEARTLELLDRSPALKKELLERAAAHAIPELERFGLTTDDFVSALQPQVGAAAAGAAGGRGGLAVEAIVRRYGRPVLLIQNGKFAKPELPEIAARLEPHRARIEKAIARVGRVEFVNHAMPWGGTGWVVAERTIITNRHVAELVAESDGRGGFRFRTSPAGMPFGAALDFREEYEVAGDQTVRLRSVRFLASEGQPDVALLEVDTDVALPEPLSFEDAPLASRREVVIVGYPAYDSRNDPDDVARYFGEIFDVKRLAPGEVTQIAGSQAFFMHDATTLGGNSGSLVLDPASGKIVGLHFAGQYLQGNYAVDAKNIQAALKGMRVAVAISKPPLERADGTHDAAHFAYRAGYLPHFLGRRALNVPLPGLGEWESDAAEVALADGTRTKAIPYTHFSVVFSKSRRVPLFTAVNIDGAKSRRIKRSGDQWFADLRLPKSLQLTSQDYGHPEIDRGHMVRREDPNWGSAEAARLANDDTFHYTNAAPQHARLNQGRTQWLGLEEYVLGSARTHGFKVSVFTGPVLRDGDAALDDGVLVPEEFWKVVVAVDADGALRATGYVLSQGKLIQDITEAFTYGEYRTYQVPLSRIARATGLDFGALVGADPLEGSQLEGLPGVPVIVALDRLENMVL